MDCFNMILKMYTCFDVSLPLLCVYMSMCVVEERRRGVGGGVFGSGVVGYLVSPVM